MSDIVGLYVGQLTPDEMELLERGVEAGTLRWSYAGVAGLLGLAKVERVPLAKLSIPNQADVK